MLSNFSKGSLPEGFFLKGNGVFFKTSETFSFLSFDDSNTPADSTLTSLLEVRLLIFSIVVVSSIIVETVNSPFKALSILSLIVSCDGSEISEEGVLSSSYSLSVISLIWNFIFL